MTTMKLSTAIRLGSMLKPQSFYGPHGIPLQLLTESCALAAAAEAAGLRKLHCFGPTWPWPWTATRPAACPACDGYGSAGGIIAHLNDRHRWTREQIADWVETIEALSQGTAQPDAVLVDPSAVSS